MNSASIEVTAAAVTAVWVPGARSPGCGAPWAPACRALALLLLMAVSHDASAEFRYAVQKNDTLATVASRTYGSAWKASIVAAFNGLSSSATLHQGQRLKIPVLWTYSVRRALPLSQLAKKLLGDERRVFVLVQLNGIKANAKLQRGNKLLIPAVLRHSLKKGESLYKLSRRYYRSKKHSALLRDYNFLTKKKLDPGTKILIPLLDRSLTAEAVKKRLALAQRAASASKPKPAPTKEARPRGGARAAAADKSSRLRGSHPSPTPDQLSLQRSLSRAENKLKKGDFEGALNDFSQLQRHNSKRATFDQSAHKRLLLGRATALVALERRGEAMAALQKIIELEPGLRLDPVQVSPKIMVIFEQAKAGRAP